MANFGETVARLRNKFHWTQDDLAREAGLSRSLIQKIEKMESSNLRQGNYRRLAEAFQMNPFEFDAQWRATRTDQQIPENQRDRGAIPHLQQVPAGPTTNYDAHLMGDDRGLADWYLPRVITGVDDPTAFALTVAGDSMMPDYAEGDIVVCSPQAVQESGMVAAFRLDDDECGIKRIVDVDAEFVDLVPINSRHATVRMPRERIVSMSRVVYRGQRLYSPPAKPAEVPKAKPRQPNVTGGRPVREQKKTGNG